MQVVRSWTSLADPGEVNVPPPSESTFTPFSEMIRANVVASIDLNPDSPSSAKICPILRPASFSTALSRSMKSHPLSRFSSWAVQVFPHPIKPVRVIMAYKSNRLGSSSLSSALSLPPMSPRLSVSSDGSWYIASGEKSSEESSSMFAEMASCTS